MRRYFKIALGLILVALLVGFALAQDDLPAPTFDPATWFASTAALAGVIVAAVAFIKRNILQSLSGIGTIVFSFALGIAVSVAATFTGYFDATLLEAVSFGAGAALLASGGWDAVVTALGKSRE